MRPNSRLSSRSWALGKRLCGGVVAFVMMNAVAPNRSRAEPCEGLCWSAPIGCPSQSDVVARIRQLAEGRFVFEGRGWTARVAQTPSSWHLELIHGEQRREIEAPSCATLAEAAAVAIVLSEPPGVNGFAPSVPGEPGATSLTPAAEASLGDAASESAARRDGSESVQSPWPGATERSALGAHERASEPAVAQRAVTQQPAAHSREVNLPRAASANSAPHADEERRWQLAAAGFWDSSLIPGGAFGAQLGAGYQWAPRHRVVVLGLMLQPRRTPIDAASPVATVDYTYAAGSLRTCSSSATRPAVEGCAGLELGALSARAVGLAAGQRQQSLFSSFALTLGSGAEVGPLQLRFALEGIVPLLRDRFTANAGALLVHETPRVSFRLAAGVVWPF